MIETKSPEDIEKIREGGAILASILEKVKSEVKPGVTTLELDGIADKLINEAGEPSFKKVRDYKWATCMCVNEVVVHGIPGKYKLKEGDVLGIDLGMLYKGFNTDMSWTVRVKGQKEKPLDEVDRFVETGRKALEEAINQARPGNRVGHISKAIQDTVRAANYSPVEALVGHGIGRNLHEEPPIPCFLKGTIENTPALLIGMTIAIEVIYNQGTPQIMYQSDDGWTIQTADNKLSGLFEQTVAILASGPEVLTKTQKSSRIDYPKS